MLDQIMGASPSTGSWRCDPMSVSEIDAHPDADRIWATIKAIRDEVDAAYQRGCDDTSGEIDDAVAEEFDRCVEEFEAWVSRLLDRPDLTTAQHIRDALVSTSAKEALT